MKSFPLLTLALTAILVAATSSGCRNTKSRNQNKYDGLDQLPPNGEWLDGDKPLAPGSFSELGDLVPPSETGLSNVYFGYNAQNIGNSEIEKIRAAAELLALNPSLVIVAEGHCDERGTSEYNITLGEHRALSVRDQLIAFGIAPSRIQTLSYGKEKPADTSHNESAWRRNRRAEFAVYRLRK